MESIHQFMERWKRRPLPPHVMREMRCLEELCTHGLETVGDFAYYFPSAERAKEAGFQVLFASARHSCGSCQHLLRKAVEPSVQQPSRRNSPIARPLQVCAPRPARPQKALPSRPQVEAEQLRLAVQLVTLSVDWGDVAGLAKQMPLVLREQLTQPTSTCVVKISEFERATLRSVLRMWGAWQEFAANLSMSPLQAASALSPI
eukprot:3331302-Amphidinium_carterae.1